MIESWPWCLTAESEMRGYLSWDGSRQEITDEA